MSSALERRFTWLVNHSLNRTFRTRAVLSQALDHTYKIENPKAARSWPPPVGKNAHQQFNEFDRLELLRHLRHLEMQRMKQLQPFDVSQFD